MAMNSRFLLVLFALLAAVSSSFTIPSNARTITTRIHAGPAVLEPTIKEPETVEKEDLEDKTKDESKYKKGGWAVRLFNDPMNKREFVAMCLSKITGLSDGQAYQVMMQAHQNGVSVVGRYDQERAELYRDSLRDNGLSVDMIPVEDD
ncbi:protease adapter protein ClpS [Seminavis robusta]|uniref:Protease adapter protein ClpS n=1 Tax=Seminavis robusta TaxID=568900 RepID=A0A9N8DF77_9STRA|nr:protease adapter protein ClpS [Seminavis robusta]|eukprot:Sro41_g025180.1 protease adapter protein ClpS (148) ;mRNA; r:76950-77393